MGEDNKLTNTILSHFIQRPVFLNCQVNLVGERNDISDYYLNYRLDADMEIVGSAKDGLQCGKIFDVGDVDILFFSKHVKFDQSDESYFQYHPEDPSFLKIAVSDVRTKIPGEIGGIYLKSNNLRYRMSPFFDHVPWIIVPNYDILECKTTCSATKCATTGSFSYSDQVPKDRLHVSDPDAVSLFSYRVWESEHAILSYLLYSQYKDQIEFVREILYPKEDIKNDQIRLTRMVKFFYASMRKDIRNNLFGTLDAVYFKSYEFCQLFKKIKLQKDDPVIEKAIHCNPHGRLFNDFVPAIKCSGWPGPAGEWKTRKRLWPNAVQVEQIINMGFQLVAKPPFRNPDTDHHFCLSFSRNAQKLAEFLPFGAKIALRLLKHFYKILTENSPSKQKLKSLHLKTALFWVAEQTDPTMWAVNHVNDIRNITDFIINRLQEGNLPGYFIPDSNLFQQYDKQVMKSTESVLKYISSNFAACVYIAIQKEWKLMELTIEKESFVTATDPGYWSQFSWKELIQFFTVATNKVDNYPIYEMMENREKLVSPDFYRKYIDDVFIKASKTNNQHKFNITLDQLDFVWVFRKLLEQMDIDPFNIIHNEMPAEFYRESEVNYEEGFLQLYPKYDSNVDLALGDYVNSSLFLRIKYYANVYHLLCEEIVDKVYLPDADFQNEDTRFVIDFLKQLMTRTKCLREDLQDILHYLLYFCHYTKLRHHKLSIGLQIVRSMREFFERPRSLFTIYFNPLVVFPIPVITDSDLLTQIVQI